MIRERCMAGQLVSTHSRPKAAATVNGGFVQSLRFQHTAARRRLPARIAPVSVVRNSFNTQPPEGGCSRAAKAARQTTGFNTQPPEGGCFQPPRKNVPAGQVSTHSRPKAAAKTLQMTHASADVSTHSRPKAAASEDHYPDSWRGSFNTQPPEGGCLSAHYEKQHTIVSTHSRPKAAAPNSDAGRFLSMFQHTAARRRLRSNSATAPSTCKFQHTAARRRLRRRCRHG